MCEGCRKLTILLEESIANTQRVLDSYDILLKKLDKLTRKLNNRNSKW